MKEIIIMANWPGGHWLFIGTCPHRARGGSAWLRWREQILPVIRTWKSSEHKKSGNKKCTFPDWQNIIVVIIVIIVIIAVYVWLQASFSMSLHPAPLLFPFFLSLLSVSLCRHWSLPLSLSYSFSYGTVSALSPYKRRSPLLMWKHHPRDPHPPAPRSLRRVPLSSAHGLVLELVISVNFNLSCYLSVFFIDICHWFVWGSWFLCRWSLGQQRPGGGVLMQRMILSYVND